MALDTQTAQYEDGANGLFYEINEALEYFWNELTAANLQDEVNYSLFQTLEERSHQTVKDQITHGEVMHLSWVVAGIQMALREDHSKVVKFMGNIHS